MKNEHPQIYQTKSAVLFIIFNRPQLTREVFSKIRQSRPAILYIAADGPRGNVPGEAELCEQARYVAEQVDWPCDVKTLFRSANMGCKEAVSSAITWFFEQEEEGIILEDDCLPSDTFFRFCDEMLALYRNDNRIRHISGCNLQHGKIWGDASYYFSNLTHVWGWAGWRRVWKDYDKELSRFNKNDVNKALNNIFNDSWVIGQWTEIFNLVKAGKVDTWDYQLTFLNFFNNSLSVIPNINLISNIGFGVESTHTHNADSLNAGIPAYDINGIIIHPLYILPERQADLYTLYSDFNITARKKKYNRPHKKVTRWFKGFFK